jgi:flagellar basal-body rod protein FlgG
VAQANVDVIANNLANVDTTGFKRTVMQVQSNAQQSIYRDQTEPGQSAQNRLAGISSSTLIGTLGSGSNIYDTPSVFSQGPIKTTGNTLDFALSGPGFFTVQNAQGQVRYTRDGSFQRDATNRLVTSTGDLVLDNTGKPITVATDFPVSATRNGTITSQGQPIAQLGITEFTNTTQLRPEGSNNFVAASTAAGATPATQTTVLAGSIESSTTDVIHSMVDLISNERWFDANEKMIQTQDQEVGNAISTVGKSTSS